MKNGNFQNILRVICKLCLPRRNSRTNLQHHCSHGLSKCDDPDTRHSHGSVSQPKLCARHRVPSLCGSETTSRLSGGRQYARSRSYASNNSEATSNADLDDLDESTNLFIKRRRDMRLKSGSFSSFRTSRSSRRLKSDRQSYADSLNNMNTLTLEVNSFKAMRTHKESTNRVHFHLNQSDDEAQPIEHPETQVELIEAPHYANLALDMLENLTDDSKSAKQLFKLDLPQEVQFDVDSSELDLTGDTEPLNDRSESAGELKLELSINLDNSDSTGKIGWDTYWDRLESNVLGNE